jgi:hypothetical protein
VSLFHLLDEQIFFLWFVLFDKFSYFVIIFHSLSWTAIIFLFLGFNLSMLNWFFEYHVDLFGQLNPPCDLFSDFTSLSPSFYKLNQLWA